jgi:hypothetical protein
MGGSKELSASAMSSILTHVHFRFLRLISNIRFACASNFKILGGFQGDVMHEI